MTDKVCATCGKKLPPKFTSPICIMCFRFGPERNNPGVDLIRDARTKAQLDKTKKKGDPK